ncbi:NACHT domain-containing protein [Streptomyces sp. NPDC005791]|uniref:NACHT domain-containing protein n=1 Tax=unclassified Streptomyces TaxID=2593676 RepID=UPI0033DD3B1A
MAGGGGSRATGDDGSHQEISGGTQQNVVFGQVIENVHFHGGHDFRTVHGVGGLGPGRGPDRGLGTVVLQSAVVLLGVFLLLARPGLPLPAEFDPGPVTAGWSLLVGAVGYAAWSRVRRERARRRLAAWRTKRNLVRAAEALAEGLAVRYDQDERLTRINDPYPLDVAWTTPDAEEEGAAGEEQEGTDAEERRPSARLAPAGIADYYTATPARRLVVLGGAGAGKSVFVLRLAHALLHRRAKGSGDPVPAVVSLASWDPGQGLLRWMADQLADAHPEACTPVPGAPAADVAFHLLLTGRVLPVLDGFDELPGERRAAALHQISQTMRGRRPFVLAGREPEYREHAPDEVDFERTEIRLSPLGDATVRAYLSSAQAHTRWTPVLDRLTDHSGAAPPEVRRLREVLSVPLMVGLARAAYAHTTSDPSELLDPDVFGSRADIERHLYDAFLDAVYSSSHDMQAAHGGWSPQQARTWIGYLAARMKAANEQDLAWWRLDETLPRFVAVLVLVPALLVGTLSVAGLTFGLPWWRWQPLPSLPGAYAMLCALVLVAEAAVRTVGRQEPPRRLHRPDRDDGREAFAEWPDRARAVLAAIALAAAGTAASRWGGSWIFPMIYVSGVVVWWYGRRILGRVWRLADPAVADTPAALLRADRRGVLTLGWFPSLRPDNEATPLRYVLLLPPVMLLSWQFIGGGRDVVTGRDWALMAVEMSVYWLLFSFGFSAWGGFTMARLYFWATGRLPWQLLSFLEDAHARGVLRQAGGVYRFRHIELRDRLARGVPAEVLVRPRAAPGRVRRAVAMVLVLAASGGQLVVGSGAVLAERLPGPVRSLPAACELLDPADLTRLMKDPAEVGAADGASCSAGEQAPFSRNVSIGVHRSLGIGDGIVLSGTERAQTRYVELRDQATGRAAKDVSHGGFHRDLSGLGHEAYLAVRSRPAAVTTRIEQPQTTASVGMRIGNALIELDYTEEFASVERAAEIVQILARQALRQADLAATRPLEEDPKPFFRGTTEPAVDGPLASVTPQSALPSKDHRFVFHNRRAAGSVYGATWQGDERSYLWHLESVPFVFRAPTHMDCRRGEYIPDDSTYTCTALPDHVTAGLVPELRLEIRSLRCGENCTDERTASFLRSTRAHAATTWTKHDERAYYAADPVGDSRYRMAMKRSWAWQNKSEGTQQAFLLWVRIEVPFEHRALAQKVVNGIYAQTGGAEIMQFHRRSA